MWRIGSGTQTCLSPPVFLLWIPCCWLPRTPQDSATLWMGIFPWSETWSFGLLLWALPSATCNRVSPMDWKAWVQILLLSLWSSFRNSWLPSLLSCVPVGDKMTLTAPMSVAVVRLRIQWDYVWESYRIRGRIRSQSTMCDFRHCLSLSRLNHLAYKRRGSGYIGVPRVMAHKMFCV
jgi:hypothetical protein